MQLNPHGNSSIAMAVLCPLILLVGSTGCQTAKIYTVANMPADLQAVRQPDAQSIDLSRLAGQSSNDRIECGDVIEVSIAAALIADAVITFPVRVDDSGMAVLPEVGQLQLAGLGLAGAERSIAAACGQRGLYSYDSGSGQEKEAAVDEPSAEELSRQESRSRTGWREVSPSNSNTV